MKTVSANKVALELFGYSIVFYALIQFAFPVQFESGSRTEILAKSALFAAIFSGVMAVVLHFWKQRAGFDAIPSARQSAEFNVERDTSSATAAVVEVLNQVKAKSITVSTTTPVIIKASTRMTWKSFGEQIEVAITRVNDGRSSVLVSTRPTLPTTLVDYGKGLDNVRRITDGLAVA